MTADEITRLLDLQPHPEEGGWFHEIYRSPVQLPGSLLPGPPEGDRSLGTAIYYLLKPGTFSEMHRLPGDEIFHFYMGDPVEMLQLAPDGSSDLVRLGTDLAAGERPQVVVEGGIWQGSMLTPGGAHGFALLGTTMAPGFDFADYERGSFVDLVAGWPDHRERLRELTRV